MRSAIPLTRSTRWQHVCAVWLVAVGTASGAAAQTQAPPKFETFTATTENLAVGSGEAIKINVFKWSADDERTKVAAALNAKDEKAVVDGMGAIPSAGYVWTSETLGYPLRYAFKQTLPSGVERVVVLTDRRLGSWSGAPWKAANDPNNYPYTLIELRFPRTGLGQGKMSLSGKVGADSAGAIGLENYDAAPLLLKSVKREPTRSSH